MSHCIKKPNLHSFFLLCAKNKNKKINKKNIIFIYDWRIGVFCVVYFIKNRILTFDLLMSLVEFMIWWIFLSYNNLVWHELFLFLNLLFRLNKTLKILYLWFKQTNSHSFNTLIKFLKTPQSCFYQKFSSNSIRFKISKQTKDVMEFLWS